jgi:AcrR family transcriptional regulator
VTDTVSTVIQRNLARTRAELLEASVRLIERGEEPTMRSVAQEAGISERTIYRYFATRRALEDAVTDALRPRLGAPLCSTVDELDAYIADLFGVFEENRPLTVATVTAAWTQPGLSRSRSRNLEALTELLSDGYPDADPQELAAAAATLRTVASGAGWVYQRVSCGLPNEIVTANAQWLARVVLDRLSASS